MVNSCFPIGNTGLIFLIIHFHFAKFSVPIAGQTLEKALAEAPLQWGRVRPSRFPAIALTVLARWPQEGGFCKVVGKPRMLQR